MRRPAAVLAEILRILYQLLDPLKVPVDDYLAEMVLYVATP